MICSSVNRLALMSIPPSEVTDSTHFWRRFRGSGQALRVDQKEHINKIDDEIIAEIRRSRFVVADFTSREGEPRGGVYFEAGFAYGIAIPVIWMCRSNLIGSVQFDTRQFNHITWDDPANLYMKLRNRIGAVIWRWSPPTTDHSLRWVHLSQERTAR